MAKILSSKELLLLSLEQTPVILRSEKKVTQQIIQSTPVDCMMHIIGFKYSSYHGFLAIENQVAMLPFTQQFGNKIGLQKALPHVYFSEHWKLVINKNTKLTIVDRQLNKLLCVDENDQIFIVAFENEDYTFKPTQAGIAFQGYFEEQQPQLKNSVVYKRIVVINEADVTTWRGVETTV